ncbi:MAG TPA: hypothetical protein VF662_00045 [Allosphingosinicella sp.]
MASRHLLIGISTLALAAGTASAQNNNQVTTSGSGSVGTCNNSGTSGNICRIIQVGNNDSATVTQGNAIPSSTRNTGIITQIGDNDSASITQNGNDNFGQLLQGTSTQRASNNSSTLSQQGFLNSATVSQNGDGNDSSVAQNGGQQNPNSTSGASLEGSGNIVRIVQNTSQTSSQGRSSSTVNQTGNSNSVSVTQSGITQRSTVAQGGDVQTGTIIFPCGPGTNCMVPVFTPTSANSNSVTIMQSGSFGSSTVTQQAPGTGGNTSVTNNVANVRQDSENSTGTGFGGASNVSNVTQQSSGNTAVVVMTGGNNAGGFGTTDANTRNVSQITQRNSTQSSTVLSNNVARAFLGRGDQLSSTIAQDGRNNFAEVTLASGVAGSNSSVQGGRSTGNSSAVSQIGRGSVAVVVTQAGRGQTGQGIGNVSSISQTATANFAAPTGGVTAFNSSSETGFFPGSRGLYAVSYQQGQFGNLTINQSDTNAGGGGSGTTYSNGAVARARAQVFQAGRLMSVTVNQTGDNFADVTQGRLGLDASGTINLDQTDAGDTSVAGGGFDPQGNPNSSFNRQSNTATIVQYGTSNTIFAQQNTRAGSATIFQNGGSTNNVDMQQGTGSTQFFNADSPSTISASPSTGANTQNLTASITQGGSNNGMRVRQDGTSLVATVSQLGTGTGAPIAANAGNAQGGTQANQSNVGNIIQVIQQGTNNQATARQTANVGQSAAGSVASGTGNAAASPGAFTGGARSPEINILQGGTGQRAYAEQRGKGQVARIEQNGTNNTAGILQDTGATNATARITQSGTGNSFFVVQTQPGEFINVNQTGSNNTAVTQSGATGSGSFQGTAAPAGFPTF